MKAPHNKKSARELATQEFTALAISLESLVSVQQHCRSDIIATRRLNKTQQDAYNRFVLIRGKKDSVGTKEIGDTMRTENIRMGTTGRNTAR
jgi:hypothetical protein